MNMTPWTTENVTTTIAKRNGTLTMRETVRHMQASALENENQNGLPFSYIAKRLDKPVATAMRVMRHMKRHNGIQFVEEGRKVIFS